MIQPSNGKREKFSVVPINAWSVILVYALTGTAWIIWSDLLLDKLAFTKSMTTNLSMIKGCFFVLLTSGLLYMLLRLYRRSLLETYRTIEIAENNYRDLFESNPAPMWIYDLENFSFLMVNQAAVARYGYSHDEFLQMNIFDIRPVEDHAALEKNLQEDPNNGYIFSGVWKHVKKNGEVIFVEIDSHPITYQGRKAKLVLSLDVTQLIQTQSEFRAVADELNTFVYRASHDLRGPLARLIGITDLMKHNHDVVDRHEYVDLLSKTARLMDNMLQRLLSVNNLKAYTPQLKKVYLRRIVDEIIAVSLETNGVDLPIHNAVPDDLTFTSDPKIILLALENLIDNAIKYRDPAKSNLIEVTAEISLDQVRIVVSDDGIGITEEVKPRIFDLFFRGTERSHGSGLGLYIAREAVKRQQGEIHLKDGQPNKTAFEVSIPVNL